MPSIYIIYVWNTYLCVCCLTCCNIDGNLNSESMVLTWINVYQIWVLTVNLRSDTLERPWVWIWVWYRLLFEPPSLPWHQSCRPWLGANVEEIDVKLMKLMSNWWIDVKLLGSRIFFVHTNCAFQLQPRVQMPSKLKNWKMQRQQQHTVFKQAQPNFQTCSNNWWFSLTCWQEAPYLCEQP